jgi:hypothetical protein
MGSCNNPFLSAKQSQLKTPGIFYEPNPKLALG